MFDIAPSELLLVVIVAIVVIGPKDLPLALRTAGRWIGKVRRVSNHFRAGIETMIREAEMEELEKKWREQNAAIMAANPTPDPAAGQTVEAAADQNIVKDHAVDPLIAAHAPTDPVPALTGGQDGLSGGQDGLKPVEGTLSGPETGGAETR
ncbi:Sec-independent protein translocase protein TatB [Novosphingobium cyanobacteriorum]|uniref:Sec-independent protein translocase protein TatB n=1 Tax=Novosphingobium cyanobacteriorum TaxID=3024215 RepID=A0ABT6CHU5_9SPHN|nr:Sec-independent protein translocase protein TatB [Novosphingobium cyanobacteriorum]MDF8333361.1 Sec-independent protein translocase protein TatB [Novosphingobium cyanobacteriorum]